jgi:hypothetical protein
MTIASWRSVSMPLLCPSAFHADDSDDAIARVDELLRLDAPLSPGGSPFLKPAPEGLMSPILALVRRVVVEDLDLLVKSGPVRLARRLEVLDHPLDYLHVLT